MNEPMQFRFSLKAIGVDERLSDSFVTETNEQKEAICRLCQIFSGESVILGGKGEILPLFTSLYTSEKCFFLRVHDTVENCITTVHNFGNWCMIKADMKELFPMNVFVFFTGSDEFKLTHQNETMESILTVHGINHDEMEMRYFLNIDEAIVKPNCMEVSVIISFIKPIKFFHHS